MLFFKSKPKEKFKYLPAFNSSKFFGEKKRKNQLDFKPLVKVLKPTAKISELPDTSLENQIDIKNPRSFPGTATTDFTEVILDKIDNLSNLKVSLDRWLSNLLAKFTIILTLKAFVIGVMVSIFTLVGLLAFIDTNFIITNWQFEFSPNSYLDSGKSRELQKFLQSNRLAGIIPNNHLLFLDATNMEISVKDKFPEITKIDIVQKSFPSSATIRISTEPVLATLIMKVNSQTEFWRIAQNGKIISRDNHNLLTNSIYVDKDITYNKEEGSFEQTNFFGANLEQLDKLYTIEYVKELVTNFGLKIARVSIPSLSSPDKNFTIWLDNQVRLIFNSSQFDKRSIEARVQKVLNSPLLTQIKSSKIRYIDMRVAYRIYVG